MMIYPWLSMIIGAISGIVSVLGCRYLSVSQNDNLMDGIFLEI